jgi:hypothetical protein
MRSREAISVCCRQGLETFPVANTSNVATFSPASSGRYLAGGDGFSILDGDGKLLQRFVPEASPVDPNQNWVVAAMEDRAGDIWFGAMGGACFTWQQSTSLLSITNNSRMRAQTACMTILSTRWQRWRKTSSGWEAEGRGSGFLTESRTRSLPCPTIWIFPNGLKTKEISVLYRIAIKISGSVPGVQACICIGLWSNFSIFPVKPQRYYQPVRQLCDGCSANGRRRDMGRHYPWPGGSRYR